MAGFDKKWVHEKDLPESTNLLTTSSLLRLKDSNAKIFIIEIKNKILTILIIFIIKDYTFIADPSGSWVS